MSAPSLRALRAAFAAIAAIVLSPAAQAQSSPSDFTSATRYDSDQHVTGTIAPDPDGSGPLHYAAVRNTYDGGGRLTRVEKGELSAWQAETVAPASWTGFTVFSQIDASYDVMNRKTAEQMSAGGTAYALTQYSYDSFGRLDCTAVRMNPAIYGTLPSSACTLGTEGSQGPDRITRNVYDAAGQLLKVQKAYGTALQQDYGSYAYSANGKPIRLIDANGNVASMTYDGFDRQIRWNFPDKTTGGAISTTDYEAYSYDANGNRLTLRKRDASVIGYSYDAFNRVLVKDIPGGTGTDVYYGYDLQGLQLFSRFASTSGAGLTNSYDGFGHLVSASSNLDGTSRTLAYQYDADGNRTRVTHPDSNYFAYVYDGLDRPVAVQENGSSQVVSIAYDNQGRRSGDARGVVLTGYGYDAVSRLNGLSHDLTGTSGDVSWGLAYNPASQIVGQTRGNDAYAFTGYTTVSKTYAVNGLNQYTAADGGSPLYDLNGNLTSDGTTGYTYDVENRLVASSTGATLSYDPSGRLWQMTMGSSTVRFLYDGDALVEERDGSGTLLRRYVHGNGEDDPLLWYDGAGLSDRRSLEVDHQGSITSIANADGTLRTIDSYDEYGMPGSGNDGRFQYTGQAWLPALGLYYYKARIYSPKLGRFLQTDPIGYKDQINLYAYVGDDPIDRTDPSGQDASDVVHGVLAAASFCPSVCGSVVSGIDAGIYLAQGDKLNATISGSAALLGVVSDAGAVRLAGTIVKEGIAFTKAERAGSAAARTATATEKMLYRRGAYDTRQALRQQSAAAAKSKIGVHGVSVSTSPAAKAGQVVRCATCSSVEAAGFKVQKTGQDPDHFTVHMPEVITREVANAWNSIWK